MIFRQLFEPLSSTYTYLLGCEVTRQAVLIDPVMPMWERDLGEVRAMDLRLAYTLDTHIHAEHITSALRLKRETGCAIANAAGDHLPCTDVGIVEGKPFEVGGLRLQPLHTPGHTESHFSFLCADRLFTGDALLIDGCGRTDFQNGDPEMLYRAVHDKLFALPDETLVYPAHDYQGRSVSSIGQERPLHGSRACRKPAMRRLPREPSGGAGGVLREDEVQPAGLLKQKKPRGSSPGGSRLAMPDYFERLVLPLVLRLVVAWAVATLCSTVFSIVS